MNSAIFTVFAIFASAAIGSFLSVCIYRIPRGRDDLEHDTPPPSVGKDGSRVSIADPPRSFCPQCFEQLQWWHNIPIVSWIILRGRCAFCKQKISFRYPFVELLSAVCCVLSIQFYGFSLTALLIYLFCCSLIVISFIDIDYYIIPNVISLPGTVIGVCVGLLNQYTHIFTVPVAQSFLDSVYGILAGGGFLFVISEVYLRLRKKEGLGMGDVKLLAMTGAFFGWEAAFYTIFIGSLAGSVLGIALILFSGRSMSQHLPFGPYLAVGTLLYLFSGPGLFFLLSDGMAYLVRTIM